MNRERTNQLSDAEVAHWNRIMRAVRDAYQDGMSLRWIWQAVDVAIRGARRSPLGTPGGNRDKERGSSPYG